VTVTFAVTTELNRAVEFHYS